MEEPNHEQEQRTQERRQEEAGQDAVGEARGEEGQEGVVVQLPGDPFDLQRFIDAQASCYATALAELKAGRKQSHWMWFIFPQLRGLGRSHYALHYGITGLAEAQAYLDHPVLGIRSHDAGPAATLTNQEGELESV